MAHNVFGEVDKICFRSYSKKYGEALQKLLFSKGYDWDINVNKEKFKCYSGFNSDYLVIDSNVLFQSNFVRNNQKWSIEKLVGELPNHPLKSLEKKVRSTLKPYWIECQSVEIAKVLIDIAPTKGYGTGFTSLSRWEDGKIFELFKDGSCGFHRVANGGSTKLSIEEFLRLDTSGETR